MARRSSSTSDVSAGATPPPFKPLAQRPADASIEARSDGSFMIRSNHAPGRLPGTMSAIFRQRAGEAPARDLLLERAPGHGPWRALTYGDALASAEAIAQWLIDAGLGQGDSVLVLSGNSIDHALLMLGCYLSGVAVAPVSAAYSLMSQDHAKLLHCARILAPKAVFAREGAQHARAIERLRLEFPGIRVITSDAAVDGATPFAELLATPVTPAVDTASAAVTPDTVAKYLFTSGSTGMPKCVPQTHRVMTAVIAGQDGLASEPRGMRPPPVTLEWMPWSHISGGNIFFNGVIFEGGTMYLDEGRPIPGLFETTIRNLREVSPTGFGSAPVAFAMLADAMEGDADLRRAFFANMRSMGYGGATLSDDLYDRLQALAVAETGERMAITTMYGATETQGVAMVHWAVDRVGLIGLPMPGIELKLVPNGTKLEVRVRGASVATGYRGGDSSAAFDEEGYYRLGDAARFVDPDDVNAGLIFDGRVSEDFKLSSGTWVSVGTLRPDLVAACSPLVHDVVITGRDQLWIGAMAWPSPAAVAQYVTTYGDDALSRLTADIAARIAAHNAVAGGSSRVVQRLALLTDPPSIDSGEMTDKGYINQMAVLDRRAYVVARLHAGESSPLMVDVPR